MSFPIRCLHIMKYPVFFVFGFYSNKFWKTTHIMEEYEEPKSEFLKDFIKKESLDRSIEYDRFVQTMGYETFVESNLVKKLEGLSIFNIYFKKDTIDKINESIPLESEEEKKSHGKLYCIFSPNSPVQGHMGIVHGGFTATLIDNLLGN